MQDLITGIPLNSASSLIPCNASMPILSTIILDSISTLYSHKTSPSFSLPLPPSPSLSPPLPLTLWLAPIQDRSPNYTHSFPALPPFPKHKHAPQLHTHGVLTRGTGRDTNQLISRANLARPARPARRASLKSPRAANGTGSAPPAVRSSR